MSIFLYGSTGYTGKLVLAEFLRRGIKPTIGGRTAEKVNAQAKEAGVEGVVVGVEDEAGLEKAFSGFKVVLNCAGPFSRTFEAVARACFKAKCHYVDVTGEIDVFESAFNLDEEAQINGVALIPGGGFDVVPSDCLSLFVAELARADGYEPKSLSLAFTAGGSLSHGTATTTVEGMTMLGLARRDGELVNVGAGKDKKVVEFRFVDDDGKEEKTKKMSCCSIPWGDISTAYRSTGIGNITVYVPIPSMVSSIFGVMNVPIVKSVFGSKWMQSLLKKVIVPADGPSKKVLEESRSTMVGEVEAENEKGEKKTFRAYLYTPNGYKLTALTSVEIARRLSEMGEEMRGFKTPAMAFGSDFVLDPLFDSKRIVA
uniref:Saccharopine dehydrogenase NADP binding domain-containing protein n=1 Tax=Palpitomonas bilix TaxID=652834 RepID=A0A7S3DEB9_9EUKA|mmetsp:Transcript_3347/g.6548  ORF Transcript_3347/g.6548 Transcript_3347/m.6548 type:complete len:370 (+) Transcript_3347:45-1154(+)